MTVQHALISEVTTPQAFTTAFAAMVFDTENADTANLYSVISSTTRFTIPAALNGRRARLRTGMRIENANVQLEQRLNNILTTGIAKNDGESTGNTRATAVSAALLLATDDYLQSFARTITGTGSAETLPQFWTSIQILAPWYQGAMASKSNTQSISAYTALSFNTENHDVGGWYDAGQPTRLTVPDGVTLVRLATNVQTASVVASDGIVTLRKNGSAIAGGFRQTIRNSSLTRSRYNNAATGPLVVTPGDYFESVPYASVATNHGTSQTWFHIEELPANLKFARAHKNADQALTAGVNTAAIWGVEAVDTGGFFDTGANTRMTVPAGISHVIVSANLLFENAVGECFAYIRKNGASAIAGLPMKDVSANVETSINLQSGILDVVEGDYFDVVVSVSTNNRNLINNTGACWFAMEEVQDSNIIIDPPVGENIGGDPVTIKGHKFTGTTGVLFDGVAATSVVVVDDMTITCVTPAHANGLVDVTIERPTFNMVEPAGFNYVDPGDPPVVTSVVPNAGTTNGGKTVTIYGSYLSSVTGVDFGAFPGTGLTIVNSSEITIVTPAHAQDLVDVTVYSPYGNFTLVDAYEFRPPLRVTQLPILLIHEPIQTSRITQLAVLMIHLPVQNTAITQIPTLLVRDSTPIPLPEILVPDVPIAETWEYRTVINIAENGKEQRVALRKFPRTVLNFNVAILDDAQRLEAYQLLFELLDKKFYYPFYHMWSRITQPVVAGATKLYFDPAQTDLRNGEIIALFDPYLEKTHLLRLETIDADGGTLIAPLPYDVPMHWLVSPCREVRITSGGMTMNSIDGLINLTIETTDTREFKRPGATSTFTTYEGFPVMTRRPLANEAVAENFDKNVIWLDNSISSPKARTGFKIPFIGGKRQWLIPRPGDLDYWRSFFDEVKGRRGAFLMPTFRHDLPLAELPALNATVIKTKNLQYFKFFRQKTYLRLRIVRPTGVIYRRVLDAKVNYALDGTPLDVSLYLNSSIGNVAGDNQITLISYLNVCRLNDDTIKLNHDWTETRIDVEVRTVNE